MTRRQTIHELAEVLAIVCADETIADMIDAILSAESDERLNSYQVDLAEALFDSLTELRPDCAKLSQEREQDAQPKQSMMDRFVDWATGWK